ncbi:MAG: hypothetical protein MK486_01085 [Gemmatimonadetes bacterium]|jgi:hypothetical protein|nr:hypothetical protein [Gemmatimonadota bacterium]MEE2847288.1 hypothetical protein [Gemmatimonadota bacterium]HAC04529.1 hypothetical protein [Gemmatimonadota bacterium]HBD96923.1 hypothetical protein [Gemmatimonadota bacterium]HIC53681.1 hypothetical protein [Gemmatimonadota bacterium]|tara:strand:- start:2067 stop:2597 length:531 start_codon:yes stop_codon:yes gene_type:complete
MKWTLRILGGFVLLVVVLVVGLFAVARIHDGPLEGGLAIVAAGAFKSGDLQSDPEEPDWSFLRDYSTVEFQLLDPVRSRTTWIMEHEGRIFIPSGYMNSIGGKIWKHWPKEAEEDGRALLRVDGKLYERQLVRIREGDVVPAILAELGRKYVPGGDIPVEQVTSGNLWLFELRPRG